MRFPKGCGYLLAAAVLGLGIAPVSAPAQQAGSRAPARQAAASAQQAAPAGNAENGRKAFIAHGCFSCHGYTAEGGVGVRLVGYADTLQSFAAYVRQPKLTMPAYGAYVTAQEVTDIYTWVRSIPPSPDPKTLDLLKP